jgi:hypothetical protein
MSAYLIARDGEEIEDFSPEDVALLLASIEGLNDPEHGSVTVANDDWYLEFFANLVCFGNAESDEDEDQWLSDLSLQERIALAQELINSDFAALNARPWQPRANRTL